jgi:hypothetical protein
VTLSKGVCLNFYFTVLHKEKFFGSTYLLWDDEDGVILRRTFLYERAWRALQRFNLRKINRFHVGTELLISESAQSVEFLNEKWDTNNCFLSGEKPSKLNMVLHTSCTVIIVLYSY